MDYAARLELLETTHTFPGKYTYKVIGAARNNFVGRVLQTVRTQLPEDTEPSFSTRETAAGRHVSVTIEPHLEDPEQVLAIYTALSQLDDLVLLL